MKTKTPPTAPTVFFCVKKNFTPEMVKAFAALVQFDVTSVHGTDGFSEYCSDFNDFSILPHEPGTLYDILILDIIEPGFDLSSLKPDGFVINAREEGLLDRVILLVSLFVVMAKDGYNPSDLIQRGQLEFGAAGYFPIGQFIESIRRFSRLSVNTYLEFFNKHNAILSHWNKFYDKLTELGIDDYMNECLQPKVPGGLITPWSEDYDMPPWKDSDEVSTRPDDCWDCERSRLNTCPKNYDPSEKGPSGNCVCWVTNPLIEYGDPPEKKCAIKRYLAGELQLGGGTSDGGTVRQVEGE